MQTRRLVALDSPPTFYEGAYHGRLTVALTLAIRMGATVQDASEVQSQVTCYALVDPTQSLATINGFFTTWVELIDACLDGQIVAAAYHVLPGLPGGIKGAPASTALAAETGILNFRAAVSGALWGLSLPALSYSDTVQLNGKIVTTPGSPAANLITYLLGTSAILEWSTGNEQLLASLKDTLIGFRKRSERLA